MVRYFFIGALIPTLVWNNKTVIILILLLNLVVILYLIIFRSFKSRFKLFFVLATEILIFALIVIFFNIKNVKFVKIYKYLFFN